LVKKKVTPGQISYCTPRFLPYKPISDAPARAYGPQWLCNDVRRPFWNVRHDDLGAGSERELTMLDQLGRKAALAFIPSLVLTCAGSRRAERLAYQHLIGRKNPLSSMCLRQ
jgi:hypothetical protein